MNNSICPLLCIDIAGYEILLSAGTMMEPVPQACSVLSALWNIGTGTDEGIRGEAHCMEEYEFCTTQSLRSRRSELMRDGYVEHAVNPKGELMYGMTDRHRWCRVFMLTSQGSGLARYAVHCY